MLIGHTLIYVVQWTIQITTWKKPPPPPQNKNKKQQQQQQQKTQQQQQAFYKHSHYSYTKGSPEHGFICQSGERERGLKRQAIPECGAVCIGPVYCPSHPSPLPCTVITGQIT